MKNLSIIAIDLPRDDVKYKQLSVLEKIEFLKNLIKKSYHEAKEKDPTALVVVAWHEYGIFEPNEMLFGKIVDVSLKNEFKKCMAQLTKELKDLLIIGGTVSSAKQSKDMKDVAKKMDALNEAYDEFNVIADLNPYDEYQEQRELFEKNRKFSFTAVKNCTYFFSDGKQQFKRIKVMPFNEIPNNKQNDHIYRFQKEFSNFSLMLDDEEILFGVEICKEHDVGVMRGLIDKNKLKKPTIQFVLSDSTEFDKENAVGDFIIYIDADSEVDISFFINSEKNPPEFIKVFRMDASNADPHLTPVKAQPLSAITYLDLVRKELNDFHVHSTCGLKAVKVCDEIESKLNEFQQYVMDEAYDVFEISQKLNDLLLGYANELSQERVDNADDGEEPEDLTDFSDLLRKLANYETAISKLQNEEIKQVQQSKR